jgi:hypothetical protein
MIERKLFLVKFYLPAFTEIGTHLVVFNRHGLRDYRHDDDDDDVHL